LGQVLSKQAKTKHVEIGEGKEANLNTVQFMRRVAHARKADPKVRALALWVLNQARVLSHDYLGEARALGDFVKQKIRYVKDCHGVEQIHDPLLMIRQIGEMRAAADCDDQSLLLATLLLSIGHQPYFRIVRYTGKDGPYNHIYVVDYVQVKGKGKKRFVMDPIVKDHPTGFEVKHASGDEIRV